VAVVRIVLLILAVGVLFELTATHIAHAQSPAEDEPADAPEEQLAAKYAPILYLREQEHECDTGGQVYEPVPVEFVLDNPDITLEQDSPGRPVVARGPTAGDLFGRGKEYYLNFPGDPSRPGCAYEWYFRERELDYQRVAYAHIAREPGHEGLVLQYWFLYYFNHWDSTHEGDWEMIQLVFEAETA